VVVVAVVIAVVAVVAGAVEVGAVEVAAVFGGIVAADGSTTVMMVAELGPCPFRAPPFGLHATAMSATASAGMTPRFTTAPG
jgi:hypothetical protein